MKKILFLLTIFLFNFSFTNAQNTVTISKKCGSEITPLKSIRWTGHDQFSGGLCYDICEDCQLIFEFQNNTDGFTLFDFGLWVSGDNNKYVMPASFTENSITFNLNGQSGKTIFGLEWTKGIKGPSRQANFEGYFDGECFKIVSNSQKNNLDFNFPKNPICKGECHPLIYSNYSYNNDKKIGLNSVNIGGQVTYGKSSNPRKGYIDITNNTFCFDEVGKQIVKVEFEDACGIRTIEKEINVVKCDENGEEIISVNCESCCNAIELYMSNFSGSNYIGNVLYFPNDFPCGNYDIVIYYSDGTAESTTSSLMVNGINTNGKIITDISFIIPNCPECTKTYNIDILKQHIGG